MFRVYLTVTCLWMSPLNDYLVHMHYNEIPSPRPEMALPPTRSPLVC